jgi:hypothetical protein
MAELIIFYINKLTINIFFTKKENEKDTKNEKIIN